MKTRKLHERKKKPDRQFPSTFCISDYSYYCSCPRIQHVNFILREPLLHYTMLNLQYGRREGGSQHGLSKGGARHGLREAGEQHGLSEGGLTGKAWAVTILQRHPHRTRYLS
jgi:hypothetical protein